MKQFDILHVAAAPFNKEPAEPPTLTELDAVIALLETVIRRE
jgi:hypothetical protein